MHLSTFVHLFTLYLINSLNINNTTSPVKLTNIFENETLVAGIQIQPGFMSYYINPNDSTHSKYLWYGMRANLNGSGSHIKSSIFTSNFTTYNISTPIPFTIDTSYIEDGVVLNSMCTSPATNDIMTCWMHWYDSSSNIECKLYHVKTNNFSDVIQITHHKSTLFDRFINILCFNNSYFIPWIRYNHLNQSSVILGAVLDLNGNILFNQIKLSSSFTQPNVITQIIATKGGTKFDVKQINELATEIFMIYYTMVNHSMFDSDLPQMISIYGYYTNISVSSCPINVYNESINHVRPSENAPFCWSDTLNFRSDCCYVSIYTSPSGDTEQDGNVSGTVTDIHGNYIKFEEYSNSENILLVNDSSDLTAVFVVSLPMISDDSTQYFMIVYGNETENIYDNYVVENVVGSVYYLQWNNTEKKYHLFHENIFNLANLVNGSASNSVATTFGGFFTYIMPQTNQLFISWEQVGWDGGDRDYLNDNLYGQIFEIE